METIDIAILILRVWVGTVIALHGINHWRSLDGTAKWFASIGFKSARIQAAASAAVEVGAGVLLVLGFMTTPASGAIVATMFVAFWTVHRFNGFFIFRPGEGYEYVGTLAATATALAIAGPGTISIDSALGLADRLEGWVGAGIVAAALVGAGVHLAVFWDRKATT